jgi:hypothetical protein
MKRAWLGCALAFIVSVTVPADAVTATSWPRTYDQNGAKIVVYQPQVLAWPNHTVLDGLAAVAVTQPGSLNPIYGTVDFTTYTSANFQDGTVLLTDLRVTATHWPNEEAAASGKLNALVRSASLQNRTVPLASVLASLDGSKALPKSVPVKQGPPVIFESEKSAILVVFDRDPILAPIEGTNLKFAVNTNWAVIFDGADSRYYLLDGDHWISASSYKGPWSPAVAPASFDGIPAELELDRRP